MNTSSYDKLKKLIMVLLMASLPFHIHVSSILIIFGVLLTMFKILAKNEWQKLELSQLSISLLFFLFVELIGLLYTSRENIGVGLFNIEKHLSFIFLPILFVDFNIDEKLRRLLLLVFVASCFFAMLFCVVINIRLSLVEGKYFHEYYFSHDRFSQPIEMQAVYFGLYLSWAVLILGSLYLEKPIKKSNIFFVSFFVLIFVLGLVATGARTVLGALTITVFANLLIYAISIKSYKTLLVAIAFPLVVAVLVSLNPVSRTRFLDVLNKNAEKSSYDSYFARTYIWRPGLEAVKENFWFGVGTGDGQTELDKKFIEYNYSAGIGLFNMHNQYLQLMLDLGLVGLFAFIAIFFIHLRNAYFKMDFLYLSFLSLFMISCLTESMLNRNKGILFFVLFGIVLFKSHSTSKSPRGN